MNTKLPTKRDLKFFLAEDVRPEANGKVSIIGLLVGERFAVQGPPPQGLANVAFVVPSLSFMFILTGGSAGQFAGRFRIIAPDKKTVIIDTPSDHPVQKLSDKAVVFGTATRPFVGPAFGTYTIRLELGKASFTFPFTVERAPDPKVKQKP